MISLVRLVAVVLTVTLLGSGMSCGQPPAPTAVPPGETPDTSTAVTAGRIHGLRIGDSLDHCLKMLGEPEHQEGGGQSELFVYEYRSRGLRIEFASSDKTISSLALLLNEDEAIVPYMKDFVPQSPAVVLDEWAPYKAETLERWVGYDLPAFKAWTLLSPDARRIHLVLLSKRKSESPPWQVGVTPQVEPLITVVEGSGSSEDARGIAFREILRGDPATWEQGQVSGPTFWASPGRLHMAYWGGRSAGHIGTASSADGVTWTRDRSSPLAMPSGVSQAYNPAIVPAAGRLLFAEAHGSGGFLGIYSWQPRGDGAWSPRGAVARMSTGATWPISAPLSVVRVSGRLYLFYSTSGHPEGGGRNVIMRCESTDGSTWTNHRIVLKPNPGTFDAAGVTCPGIYHDSATGNWTLWYTADGGGKYSLGRAVSRDGLRFADRVRFIEPGSLDPSFQNLGSCVQADGPGGSYLYMSVSDLSRTLRIIRLELKNPHTAPAFGA